MSKRIGEKTMKKLLCLVCVAMMLVSCSAFAEELPEIDFSGIKLGSTAAEVDETVGKQLTHCIGRNNTFYRTRDMATHIFGDSYNDDEVYADKLTLYIDGFGSNSIFGYDLLTSRLFFVRPIKDGVIEADDNNSIFYAGVYTFVSDKTTKKELTSKLNAQYGKAKKEGKVLVWYGANSTAIILGSSGGSVQLVYAYLEGDTMYEEGIELLSTTSSGI